MGANHNFKRYQALDLELKQLHAKVTIGASGAPTLDAVASLGVTSIVRNSAGLYTVTLDQKYPVLKHVDWMLQAASAEDLKFQLVTDAVQTAGTFQFRSVAVGTATDPASGDVVRIKMIMKNSSVKG